MDMSHFKIYFQLVNIDCIHEQMVEYKTIVSIKLLTESLKVFMIFGNLDLVDFPGDLWSGHALCVALEGHVRMRAVELAAGHDLYLGGHCQHREQNYM